MNEDWLAAGYKDEEAVAAQADRLRRAWPEPIAYIEAHAHKRGYEEAVRHIAEAREAIKRRDFKQAELSRVSDLQEAALSQEPVRLLPDDLCRVCYHGPHGIPCTDIAHDPGPIDEDGNVPDIESVCGCTDYVDRFTESTLVIHLEPKP
jgi:hypothetical protein